MAFVKSIGNNGVEGMQSLNNDNIVLFKLNASHFAFPCTAHKIKFRHKRFSFFN